MNMQRAAGLGLAVSLLASAALAQAPATKQAKDATGASFNLAGQSDAAGAFHYRDVMEGLTPTGAPTAWYVDTLGLGHVSVDASVLPAGAAKDSSVTQLDSDLKAAFAAGMAVTGPLTAAQLAGAGLATAAGQAQAHTDAGAIVSALTPPGGLPVVSTGGPTLANQASTLAADQAIQANTANNATSLSTIATNTAPSGPYGGMTATLLSNVNAATTGVAVPHVYKDSYLFSCVATAWTSATAALQYLGPDGSTWLPFSPAVSLTSNGSTGVGIGANATVRAAVTGTPTGLTCGLS